KLAREVDVDVLDLAQELEVLLGDRVNRDVVDVHLGSPDEVEQQVERPLEGIEPDGVVVVEGHSSVDDNGTFPTGSAIGLCTRAASAHRTIRPMATPPAELQTDSAFLADALTAEADAIERMAQRVR